MNKQNLMLELKLRGETDSRVMGATRIQVDGRGGLLLYGTDGATSAHFCLGELQSVEIRRVSQIAAAAAA